MRGPLKTAHLRRCPRKKERGVALMLVLGTVLILSTLVVEFAYNSHVGYELAASERDRLRAYYLARSALNLARLELRLEKDLRTRYASLLRDLGGSGMSTDPLCKQLPLSTPLLRGLASGALLEGGTTEEGREGEGGEEKASDVTEEPTPAAEEFLSFEGDFAVNCDTEERKINLNIFRADPMAAEETPLEETTPPNTPPPSPRRATTTPVAAAAFYESQKELLFSFLSQKEFEPIFHEKPDEIRKVVNAIADWADRDDRINEAPGVSGGSEDAEYQGAEYHYKVKNGKYASVAELLLVKGVGDDLYQKLAPQVTVYGDHRVNLCQSSDELVKAFLMKYIQTNSGLVPIPPTDEEKWSSLLALFREACSQPSPTTTEISQVITTAIGGTNTTALSSQMTTTNRFYRLEAIGEVHESQVKISAVLDTGQGNPNLWKMLYFRVE